ncbi:MAG: CocE/NonD family hydrolase [Bryobacteraceae bacterium]|nr:CocE/NonD family hydrolase [Bryobacteraceae bacterium]
MNRLLLLAWLALPAALAAAEYQRPVSEPIRIVSNIAVPMRDGVKLYADLYRPVREGKFPVLIVRTPYGKQRDGIHETKIQFAQRGYAVLAQDTRGRYESEGAWDPFRNEAQDGYDTVEWAARQPWSNGKVGMEGGSYLGNVQWQAAAQTPPHLVAIYPALASTSLYHNTFFHGGAFKLAVSYGWGVVRMPLRIMYPQYWHTEAYAPAELRYENIVWGLPLETLDEASSGQPVAHWRDWVKHQSYDDYWRAVSIEDKFDKVNVATHTLGGWFDLLLNGTLNGYVGMRNHGGSEASRRGARMIVGPWGHGPSRKFGDVDFGAEAMRSTFASELQFFDHHLMGMETGIDREPPVEIYLMGLNRWVHYDDWPVPGTRYTPYYLSSDGRANSARGNGRLGPAQPSGAPSDQFTYDPNNPVPSVGAHDCCGVPLSSGPVDQRTVEARNDVLVYTSDYLREPLAIAGPVRMKLHAATDGPDTDWFVKLVDVYPDGFAINVAEGILRARFRRGFDQMELLKPNEGYEFEIDLRGTANVFLPGHRIRVDITSSNFPQFDRNLNSGEDLATGTRPRVARQTIFHGASRASHILLPVVDVPR